MIIFGLPEKKHQGQGRYKQTEKEKRILIEKEREKVLKEEDERKGKEKQLEKECKDIEAREKAVGEAQLKAQEMANRLEYERLQKLKEDAWNSF